MSSEDTVLEIKLKRSDEIFCIIIAVCCVLFFCFVWYMSALNTENHELLLKIDELETKLNK